jgi:tetratricopeptide (TPR) repeat protein
MGLRRQHPVQQLREPLSVPSLCKAEDRAKTLGVWLKIVLSGLSKPASEMEQTYLLGLRALADDELEVAFDHLKAVVEADDRWAYSSAKLLVLLLLRAMGDMQLSQPLVDACMAGGPDAFAIRETSYCTMVLSTSPHTDDTSGATMTSFILSPALNNPAHATQLAIAASLLVENRFSEGVVYLEAARALTSRLSLEVPVDESDLWQAVAFTRCRCYTDASVNHPDAALAVISAEPFEHHLFFKALALEMKGLYDAALLTWDDAIRDEEDHEPKRLPVPSVSKPSYRMRYMKAKLLIQLGDHTRARRELARLYADEPLYSDVAGLLDAVKVSTRSDGRAPIPESVRHAVWRRDEGRCVQCRSQERLEFDHIIPVSRGGANTERNLQLLCERCNREKSATI